MIYCTDTYTYNDFIGDAIATGGALVILAGALFAFSIVYRIFRDS
jgi:hypothetical protein